jgi:hypothetical protein
MNSTFEKSMSITVKNDGKYRLLIELMDHYWNFQSQNHQIQ